MTVGDVSKIEHELSIGLLKVYPDSQNDHYVTLLTPECMDAIDRYLDWRRQQGEKITAASPLIRDKFDVGTNHRNQPKALQEESIHAQVVRVAKIAGVYAKDIAPDHSFRYFFNTTLMNSDVNPQFKELMMGHSIDLDDVYYKADTPQSRQKILAEYMKAVDALTIEEEYRLKKRVQDLQTESKSIEDLEKRYEEKLDGVSRKMYEVTSIVMEMAAKQEMKDMDKRLSPETYAMIMEQLAQLKRRTEPLGKPDTPPPKPSSTEI